MIELVTGGDEEDLRRGDGAAIVQALGMMSTTLLVKRAVGEAGEGDVVEELVGRADGGESVVAINEIFLDSALHSVHVDLVESRKHLRGVDSASVDQELAADVLADHRR